LASPGCTGFELPACTLDIRQESTRHSEPSTNGARLQHRGLRAMTKTSGTGCGGTPDPPAPAAASPAEPATARPSRFCRMWSGCNGIGACESAAVREFLDRANGSRILLEVSCGEKPAWSTRKRAAPSLWWCPGSNTVRSAARPQVMGGCRRPFYPTNAASSGEATSPCRSGCGYSRPETKIPASFQQREIHKAQISCSASTCQYERALRIFQGRGWIVGRGGAAYQGVLAQPAHHNGASRVTSRRGLASKVPCRLALYTAKHDHRCAPEQPVITSSTTPPAGNELDGPLRRQLHVCTTANSSTKSVGRFFLQQSTRSEEDSKLRFQCRPAQEAGQGSLQSAGSPGVRWTQSRFLIPSWFGVGRHWQAGLDS